MNRHFNRKNLALLSAGLLLIAVFSFRQPDDPRIVRILKQIETFTVRTKLQKVYIKTDKEKYMAGETIWMKAYLLDALDLLPGNASNEIYVDLIGRNNVIHQSIILQNTNGTATGDILLTDSIPDGYYQLVAYSNWMKNFDEAYFFSKTVQVVNPNYGKYLTQSGISEIKQANREIQATEKEKTIQFFPEGGSLIAGLNSRVAFKAINKNGLGVNVKGELFDFTDKKISSFESKHLGMGMFSFTPEAGKRYYAKVTFDDNSTKKIDLPLVEAKGYVLLANTLAGDQIRLNIQSTAGNSMDDKSNEFIVVGQSRGEVRYISKVIYKGKPVNINVPKKNFPEGIAQITIFDYMGQPACERLVFIHPKEVVAKTSIEVDMQNDGADMVYTIRLRNSDGKPVSGNVALSLYENTEVKGLSTWNSNILSNLLLTSDLKGKIENATGYFTENNSEAPLYLDLVMMVNGWRRFVWKEILAGQFPVLLFSPSEGLKSDEVFATTLKPFTPKITEKAYFFAVNEDYDAKLIRRNTMDARKANSSQASGTPSNTIYIDPNSSSYSNMIDYLKGRVAGVTVMETGIRIRGVNSINAGLDPLILQDNTPIPFTSLRMISPREVSTVQVLKGPDASLYGVRGANGVIIINMRTGADDVRSRNLENLQETTTERMVSFYKSREFYVPVYESWDKKPSDYNVPRSVFWKPVIAVASTGEAKIRYRNRGDVSAVKASVEGIAADGTVLFFESAQ